MFSRKKPAVELRGVHLDFKGLTPPPDRLLELLDIIKEARFNLVFAEWEDAYPWTKDPSWRSKECYSEDDIKKFLERAKALSIEVVPLIQTFGHMENFLSNNRFAHLREEKEDVSSLCPLKEGSRDLVAGIIEDILRTHRGYISRVHIGADEVWNFGSCPACKAAIEKDGESALFLSHVLPVADFLSELGLVTIMWDDMLRDWPARDLKKVADRLELAVWSYNGSSFEKLIKKGAIPKYAKAGVKIWGCPAFKGADGPTADVPLLENRIKNHMEWLEEYRSNKFVGMLTTGWSRYSTFRSPCESLEASIDSLVIAGGCLWDGKACSPEAAHKFISSGKTAKLAGVSFFECLEASRRVAEWRKGVFEGIRWIHALSLSAGENDRINLSDINKSKKKITGLISEGVELLEKWADAHNGLVPERLLKLYIDSRMKPLKSLLLKSVRADLLDAERRVRKK